MENKSSGTPNNIKVAVVGPPHSGKSVFLSYLYSNLPQQSTAIVRTAPDGEGIFSNNPNQEEIQKMRNKGKYTEEKTKGNIKNIINETANIVLVDTGGKITKENYEILNNCTHSIILSNNVKDKTEWEEFSKKCNLSIIASIDSSLDGQDELYKNEDDNILRGKVSNLIRGKEKKPTLLLNSLVSKIVEVAKERLNTTELSRKGNEHIDNDVIDMLEVAKELGKQTEDGKMVRWDPEELPEILSNVSKKLENKDKAKFFEARANWLVGATTELCKKHNINDISYYNARNNSFDKVKKSETNDIQKCRKVNDNSYLYDVLPDDKIKLLLKQTDKDILMHFDLNKDLKVKSEEADDFQLPFVNPNKNIYISGKLPSWLLAHITNTYDNKNKYVIQVGNYFVKYASENEKEIGKTTKEIELIDHAKVIENYIEENQKDEKHI